MLMLVMPARLTASMTEAKAPKGTRFVGADVDDFLLVGADSGRGARRGRGC